MKRFFLMGIIGGLLFSWVVEGGADQLKRGGTLTMAIRKDITLLNPLVSTRSVDKRVRGLVFEPLLGLDRNGKIQPNLAEDWSISEDGKVYTFKLRKGVKFHNGQEMVAEDVKFSMEYTMNPKNAASGLSDLRPVDRVVAADRHTLEIHLKMGSPVFLSLLTTVRTFSVVPNESLKEGIIKTSAFPPGTGPFRLVEWKPNQKMVLERHDGYWGHKAYLDKLILRPIANSTVRFTALRAGDVDMVDTTPFEWVQQVVRGKIRGIGYASSPADLFRRIGFNVAEPPFNNKKLRRAVAYGINRKEMMQAGFFEFGKVTDQKYPKGHVWYMEGVPMPPYDPKKAKSLLKEAGYEGETLRIMVQADSEVFGTTLQAQLRKLGMKIELNLVSKSAFNSNARKGNFEFRITGGSFYPDPSATYGRDLRCPRDLTRRTGNTSGYCDSAMDGLINKAETELNVENRKALFKEILTKAADDVPELYLGFGPRFFTFREFVKGFTTDHDGAYSWWGGGLNRTWVAK